MKANWTDHLPGAIRRKLEGREQLQQILGNTGWLFAEKLLRLGAGFLVSVWMTRYLGPERYGMLSYATSFVLLFSSIGLLGLDSIVVRNLVRDPSRREETLGSAFVLRLLGGALAFLMVVAAILLLRPGDRLTQLLVGITALGLLFQTFGTIDLWFQSQVRSKYCAYARSAAFLATSALKAVLILLEAPLSAFAWAGVADIALGSAGLLLAYRALGQRLASWRATRAMALELLRDSWPLMFTDILVLIYMRVDKIMLGEMSGNRELGIYSVAVLIAEVLYLIPTVINSSVFPSIVQARAVSEELFQDRLQRLYNLMAFLAYAVALPLTFSAEWLVPLLFGPGYAEAAPMLVGLVWAGLFINLMIARSYFLTVMNWTRLHFTVDFLGCLLNVALNLVLIPRYGAMGAVAASFVTYWFVVHGLCFLFKPLWKTGSMMTRAMLCPRFW